MPSGSLVEQKCIYIYIKEKRKQVAKLSNPRMTKPSYPFPTGCNGWGSGCDPSHGHMDTILGRGRGPSLDWNSWVADIYIYIYDLDLIYLYMEHIYLYIYIFFWILRVYTPGICSSIWIFTIWCIINEGKCSAGLFGQVYFTSVHFTLIFFTIRLWNQRMS